MSVSFSPIGPWPVVVLVALVVMVLTAWAYQRRLRGTTGRWRWFALGLRLAAVLVCVLGSLRPSVVLQEKKKQPAALVFLIDDSTSMKITDEVRGQSRWGMALKTLAQARAVARGLGQGLDVRFYRFDGAIREQQPEGATDPDGRETALGAALLEAVRRQQGKRVASVVVLSDGANNAGIPPLIAARRLRGQDVPVITVGFGSENAGAASRDIAVRDLVTSPTVFVKNQLQVRGTLVVRGFANQPIDVEMYVEGQTPPVATQRVKAPEGTEVIPIPVMRYIPQAPGEKKITLRVKPHEGELIRTNNEISTYVTVLSGGLNVLYLQGGGASWEYKYLFRALAASPDIQAEFKQIRVPATEARSEVGDVEFVPGRYNVYILGDLPANYLTRLQRRLLANAVEKGAGLIMLGGHSSFGAGGWAGTDLAPILPVQIRPGDGQIEPEGGIRFLPNLRGLESYLFQVGANRTESLRIWGRLPPITGTNQFGEPKVGAILLAQSPERYPLMIGAEAGKGRAIAFGGETWVWARASDEGRTAHRKFWRQVIFWLAHREDKGENQIKLALDNRRIAVGQKLELTVTARDAKDAPITGVQYEMRIEREGSGKADPVDLYTQGDAAKGLYYANGPPGEYTATVVARNNGKDLGRDSARFLVYQDDREMENPAADLALLRQISEMTGGESLPPEQLPKYLRSLDGTIFTEYVSQTEHRIWDNWPFLLIFTALLTLEWFLRKRHGWV
ncbi:MAG: glutamine amidotransferase [Planctomycetaceae bacterium]